MDKEELFKRAKDPGYISGIYNYCDRWCERCPLASRCLNCTLVQEQFGDLQETDESNEEFWQSFSDMLQNTLAVIKEMAEEAGIDIDEIDSQHDFQNQDIEENSIADLISHASKSYALSVDEWFISQSYLFDAKEAEMNRIRLISSTKNPATEAADINEAVEVIRWYQYQIYVKLTRAVESAQEEDSSDDDGFPKDSDGSAKVALIGIDRSISAWKMLSHYFTEQKKQILSFVASLESLKNRVDTRFPEARGFVRPGFDEGLAQEAFSGTG